MLQRLVVNWIVILLAFNMVSCGVAPMTGQVIELQPGSTIYGVQSLINGSMKFGQIWMNTSSVVFAWPVNDAWAFVGVDSSRTLTPSLFYRLTGGKANLVNYVTMGDVVKCLESNGWKVITSAEVPVGVKAILNGASGYAGSMINILVFPYIPASLPDGLLATDEQS